MRIEDRHRQIVEQVRGAGRVLVTELAEKAAERAARGVPEAAFFTLPIGGTERLAPRSADARSLSNS